MKIFGYELKKVPKQQILGVAGFSLSEIEALAQGQITKPSKQAAKQTKSGGLPPERNLLPDYRAAYLGFGLLFKAINSRATYLKGNGYNIVKNEKDRSNKYRDFCDGFLTKTGMRGYKLEQWSVNTDVFGNGQLEIVPNKVNEPIDLAIVSSETMDLKRSGFNNSSGVHNPSAPILFVESGERQGEPEAWVQKQFIKGSERWKEIEWKRIANLKFSTLGDQFLGVSIIRPILKDVTRAMNIAEGYAEAAYRHGFPKYSIEYGIPPDAYSQGVLATPEMKENAEGLAKLMAMKDVVVHPYWYKVNQTSPKMTKTSVLTEYYIDLIVATTDVPKNILLGSAADANFAAVRELNKLLSIGTKNRQSMVSEVFEKQIFPRILKMQFGDDFNEALIPKVEWKEIHEDEDREKVKMIYTLYQPPGATSGIISKEEARLMLKEIMPLPSEEDIKKEKESINKLKLDFGETPLSTDGPGTAGQQKKNQTVKVGNRPSDSNADRNPIGDGNRSRRERQQD